MHATLRRFVDVRASEVRALLFSFAYLFCLLCAYYIVRPVREEMGIAGGLDKLPWMFTATFVAMLAAVPLYAAAVARWPRRRFLPIVYRFFALHLLAFYVCLHHGIAPPYVARIFFVWLNVFNVFVVSTFWSLMADLWRSEQGKRLFGFIAAGGSAGAILGPLLTARLIGPLGAANLLLGSAILLELAVRCIHRIFHVEHVVPQPAAQTASADRGDARIGGGILGVIRPVLRSPYLRGICAQTILTTSTATVLYFQQLRLISAGVPDAAHRTALFAQVDLVVNVLTILIQALLTGRILDRIGLAVALGVVPALTFVGFIGLAIAPALWVIIALQTLRRAAHYGLERPAREILFTVVSPEAKYKSKSFIDTVVYRGSDTMSGWIYSALSPAMSAAALAAVMLPVAGAWLALNARLARGQATRSRAIESLGPTGDRGPIP